MPNFFTDNADIEWRFKNTDLSEVIRLKEGDFSESQKYSYAPVSVEDALEGYERILELVGDVSGNFIAPRAESVDREGPKLDDGRVTYAKGTQEDLKVLSDSNLMGYTLPRKYGGLNMPKVMYVAAIEMVGRADAALMTLFGLQDISETILLFANEEQKDRYLPKFASGEVTGAMVLTEPDAGSDLQAVRLKATLVDEKTNKWSLNGVKRFITNGCGEVLLVLARSEPGTKDGRGLSLFITERGPWVRVRRIEDKLGIHGSPTCELQFKDAPMSELVGQRRRGLSKYVMSLMNGARIAIAAQGVGIAEAAYRAGLAFACQREQFGRKIIDMPPITEMLLDMKMSVEAGRALLYDAARAVDIADGLEEKLEHLPNTDPSFAAIGARASSSRKLANVLTPMSKFYCCDMANRVAYQSIQIHGGSGFMRDYDVERFYRDVRITSIYEGTSELQAVAIRAGLLGGGLEPRFDEFAKGAYDAELAPLVEATNAARQRLTNAMQYVKEKKDTNYTDLVAGKLASMAVDIYIACLMLQDASHSVEKKLVAQMFIPQAAARCKDNEAVVISGSEVVLKHGKELLTPDIPEV